MNKIEKLLTIIGNTGAVEVVVKESMVKPVKQHQGKFLMKKHLLLLIEVYLLALGLSFVSILLVLSQSATTVDPGFILWISTFLSACFLSLLILVKVIWMLNGER